MLEFDTFAIQKHRKVPSSVQSYDIKNGMTGELLGSVQEQIGFLNKGLRWVVSKHLLPMILDVREKPDDSLVFSLQRSGYLFQSRLEVRDAMGVLVGYFKSKVFTISGGFQVFDKDGKYFAEVKGKLFGFNYHFITQDGTVELGQVSKKIEGQAGLAQELLFSADNYFLRVNPDLSDQPLAKMLLLAATLAIDLIYKSESRTTDFDTDI